MVRDLSDYPFSVFRAALCSTVGRLLVFYLAVGLGCAACLFFRAVAERGIYLDDLWALLIPLLGPLPLVLGLTQGWGFIALVALGVIFVYYFYQESPAVLTLPLASLIAWLETLRGLMQEVGFEHALEPMFAVTLSAWGVAAALYVVYRVRTCPKRVRPTAPG